MKEPEDLLRNAPRSAPSKSLDRNMDALFNEARQSASSSGKWLHLGTPLWATGLACLLCLLAGMRLAPPRSISPDDQLSRVPETGVAVPVPDAPIEHVAVVQVSRGHRSNASSPFIRHQSRRESRLPTAWTVTQ